MNWVGDATYEVSLDGMISAWSLGAERMTGYTANEIVGQNFSLLIHPDRRGLERGMLERLSADKSVGQYDTVRVRKDGVAVGASVTAIPLFDEQQKVVGAVQIARDLGQQKSTRSEQPDVEQRYRMAFEHAPVGIAQVSLETGEILQANQRLSQILGYVKGDLIHRRLADLIHPEDWHVEEQLLRQMQEGTLSTYTIEKRYLRANAQQAWARVTATRLDDGTGRPTRLSVVEDITERKANEAELKAREARLQAILDASIDAIVIVNGNRAVDSVNPATLQMLGYEAHELVGRDVALVLPELANKHDLLQAESSTCTGFTLDTAAAKRDGSLLPVQLSLSAVDLHDQVLYAITLHDLSNRRLLVQHISEAASREQQRIGTDLHEGVGQELAGIGFFCKSLVIRLESRGLPEADDAKRLLDLVNHALRRTRSVAHVLYPVMTGQNGLMAALEELVNYVTSTFAVRCTFHCPHPVQVEDIAKATHIYRIAQEAAHNAVHHGRPGQIDITLQCIGSRASLTVEDDGVGIDGEALASGSSGLGLQIMQSRASILDGLLEIVPRQPTGTVVRCSFVLPACELPAAR